MRKIHRIGQFRGYGGLKALVLYILSEEPKNGAELMDTIETMSHGHWKPSPGSIYPMLSKAVEENLIIKREDRRYELTPAGYEEINFFSAETRSSPASVDTILNEIDNNLYYLEDLPADRMIPYRERLISIESRLKKMNESFRTPEDTS